MLVCLCVCVRSRVLPYCSIDSLEKVVTTCRTFRVRDRKGFLRILSTWSARIVNYRRYRVKQPFHGSVWLQDRLLPVFARQILPASRSATSCICLATDMRCWAFSIVNFACQSTFSFAREMGHLLQGESEYIHTTWYKLEVKKDGIAPPSEKTLQCDWATC